MTQEEKVLEQLKSGKVGRNWALSQYITRLGSIICRLNTKGWVIRGSFVKYENGTDYVYKVISSPLNEPKQFNLFD